MNTDVAIESVLSETEGLRLFDAFLRKVIEVVISPDFSSSSFRGSVAKVIREILIFLHKEGEMYGMSRAIYNSMMDFKGRNRALFLIPC